MAGATAEPPTAGWMRADFEWSGAAADDSWGSVCNWHPFPSCNFLSPRPDGTDDDATFPWNAAGAWACTLVEEGIRDLILKGSVDFDDGGYTVVLGVTRFRIEPTSGDVEITVSATTIKTVPVP